MPCRVRSLTGIRYEYGAACELAGMGLRKDLIDLRKGVPFDKRQHGYFPGQYQLERKWIVFRETTPIAERAGVERHQV